MNLGGILGIAVTALALLGAAGGTIAFLADRTNTTRLAGLRKDILDRNERIDFLEEENERKNRETEAKDKVIEEQAKTIASHEGRITSLQSYVDASAGPMKALTDAIHSYHNALIEAIHENHSAINGSTSVIEQQNRDILGMLKNRRLGEQENIIGEVSRASEG